MNAIFNFGGMKQDVYLISEYENGYCDIQLKCGAIKHVHKIYIIKL